MSKEYPIQVGECEGMDSTTTLPMLETATRATVPASLVRDLIPVDNEDVRLEQCSMTGRSPATIVTRAG